MNKPQLPLKLFACCFVIFVAAFMPWGSVGFGSLPFFGANVDLSQTITGWNGNISLLHIMIPNWIVVAIAAVLAVIGWLRANGTDVQPKVIYRLAFYGALHSGVFVFSMLSGHGVQVGIGSLATLAAFISILRTREKADNTP